MKAPKYLQWHEIFGMATKQQGMPSVYIHNGLNFDDNDIHVWNFVIDEVKKLYSDHEYHNVLGNLIHGGLFFFESEEAQRKFYKIFEQPLTDSSAIYACTYNRHGTCETENT